MSTAVTGRQRGMTNDRVRERNEYIARLSLEGLSTRTILMNVNRVGLEKEWQPLQSERSVQRIIANHFRAQRAVPARKLRERWEAEFAVAIGQLDFLIERCALHAIRKKKWAANEYMKYVRTHFGLLQRKIKILEKQKELEERFPVKQANRSSHQHSKGMQHLLDVLDESIEQGYEQECLSV